MVSFTLLLFEWCGMTLEKLQRVWNASCLGAAEDKDSVQQQIWNSGILETDLLCHSERPLLKSPPPQASFSWSTLPWSANGTPLQIHNERVKHADLPDTNCSLHCQYLKKGLQTKEDYFDNLPKVQCDPGSFRASQQEMGVRSKAGWGATQWVFQRCTSQRMCYLSLKMLLEDLYFQYCLTL